MKTKGKNAWLITWEGPESEFNGRCKVVAVLPPQFGKGIASLLPVLYCAEYNFTLCEKMSFCIPKGKDPFAKQFYRDINPEFLYGHIPKEYLCARKVKNLRCEEGKKDCLESTLFWTELPKYGFGRREQVQCLKTWSRKCTQGSCWRKRSAIHIFNSIKH